MDMNKEHSPTREHQAPAARQRRGAAFTLVELLVVIAIIALLVTLIAPSLGEVRELARRSVCAANLHTLGVGWSAYFSDSKGKTPNMFNSRTDVSDSIAMFNFLVWTCTDGAYCNAGVLYEQKLIPSEQAYVCPSIRENSGGNWFHPTEGAWWNQYQAHWPPVNWEHTAMTYSTRRMRWYDDPDLAVASHTDTKDDHIMLWSCGVNRVRQPSSFSFMCDSTHSQDICTLSHVPGIQVLKLDGAVNFFRDDTEDGSILYNNGLIGWGDTDSNWLTDDLWMVIDGYHQPPVGQHLAVTH